MDFSAALRLQLDPAHPDVVAFVGGGGKSSATFRLAKEVAAAGGRALITHTARIAAFQTDWAPAWLESDGSALLQAQLAAALDHYGVCLVTGGVVGDRRHGLSPAAVDTLAQLAPALGVGLITVEADGSKMRPVKAPADHEPVLPSATTLLAPVMGLDAVGAHIDERHVHRPELVRALLGLDTATPVRLTPAQAAQLLIGTEGGAKALPVNAQLHLIMNKADTTLRLIYGRLIGRRLVEQGFPALLTAVGDPARGAVVERWGQIATVVLAAGAASRMGRPKQVEVVNGQPMIVRAVSVALAADLGPVYVVTGAYAEVVTAALAPLQAQWRSRLHLVHNPAWASGQASSVRCAVDNFAACSQAVIFMPTDQPFLDPVLLRRLVHVWRTGAQVAAPQVEGKLRGAPALFDREFFADLAQLAGDVGGRTLLHKHSSRVVGVTAPGQWLHDVDTPEDLAGIKMK